MKYYTIIAFLIWIIITAIALLSRNDILMTSGSYSSTMIYRVPFGITGVCLALFLIMLSLVFVPSISKYAQAFLIPIFLLTLISMQSLQIEENNGVFAVKQKTGFFTIQSLGQLNESDLLKVQKRKLLVEIANGEGTRIFILNILPLCIDKQFSSHPVFAQ